MSNRAVIVDTALSEKVMIREVEAPTPRYNEALIRVRAVSLNRGETRRALTQAQSGARPGWDFAGVVEKEAEDGSGPKAGERVVGLVGTGAWAEQIAAPTEVLAVLPESVTFAQAATLPVAGLTAYHALLKGGLLLEKKVLVTGATGGVGDFAIQLAKLSGAHVIAHVRREDQAELVKSWGADAVIVGDDLLAAGEALKPFDLALDSVGATTLRHIPSMLATNGVCVVYGTSSGYEVTFDAADLYMTGGASIYGLILFHELRTVETAGRGLSRLANLVAAGKLQTHITIEADWSEVASIADQFYNRQFSGKAVLHING